MKRHPQMGSTFLCSIGERKGNCCCLLSITGRKTVIEKKLFCFLNGSNPLPQVKKMVRDIGNQWGGNKKGNQHLAHIVARHRKHRHINWK